MTLNFALTLFLTVQSIVKFLPIALTKSLAIALRVSSPKTLTALYLLSLSLHNLGINHLNILGAN